VSERAGFLAGGGGHGHTIDDQHIDQQHRQALACLIGCVVVGTISEARAQGASQPCTGPAPAAAHGPALPPYLGFLAAAATGINTEYAAWDEKQFPHYGGKDTPDEYKRGKTWTFFATLKSGCQDRTPAWQGLKAQLLASGWQLVHEQGPGGGMFGTVHSSANGVDAWINFDTTRAPLLYIEVVEVVPVPVTLTLAQPATTPEQVVPGKGDFPYLTPIPGAKPKGGAHDSKPLLLSRTPSEPQEVVAPGTTTKSYDHPAGVSNVEWIAVYHDALTKAGWSIIRETHSADAQIIAHYGERGRNIWAVLHLNGGDMSFTVGDENDLAKSLAKDCHVALDGVLFDFNKATLKPESEPVLQHVQALITQNAALKLEVQGHTDNVGTDAYNQKLSEDRAAAVVAWLNQHQAKGDRLTSQGYGKTRPVADNNSDEGRAKNRRVEIANTACQPKRP
jgi:OOP family OmpA-OmpF porin